ncbi:MAG: glycosyl hydrolase, repeat-containing protein [Bryobacterales bacterium]|nr:glycosyl hydrolase, repeat-containing protein [Bryobacterales bacterium]
MMTRRALISVFLFVAALPAAERWDIQYSYDQLQSSLVITDLKFPSAKRGIASGYVVDKGKSKPTVVVTSDGGLHWTLVPVKEIGNSLFFLDESIGWMITDKAIWQTEEAGRSWQKVNTPKDMKDLQRLWFLDRKHGWAVGERKQAWETTDGGVTWTAMAAAAEPKVNADYTTYSVVSFANSREGIIAGWDEPPRHERVPDWMDPEAAKKRRQWPSTLVLLQTRDAGKTWDASTASIFGRVTKISFAPDSSSIGLIEFTDNFEWPSEVYRVNGHDGKSTRIFRRADRAISDVAVMPSGTVYLAGKQSTSVVHSSPIAGKLKILRSLDKESWEEMPVDYKVEAHRAMIAAPDENNIWVATDTGSILKLRKE